MHDVCWLFHCPTRDYILRWPRTTVFVQETLVGRFQSIKSITFLWSHFCGSLTLDDWTHWVFSRQILQRCEKSRDFELAGLAAEKPHPSELCIATDPFREHRFVRDQTQLLEAFSDPNVACVLVNQTIKLTKEAWGTEVRVRYCLVFEGLYWSFDAR